MQAGISLTRQTTRPSQYAIPVVILGVAERGAILCEVALSNVIALYGGEVLGLAVPRESLIDALNELLERAKSGELQGAAVASVDKDGKGCFCIAGVIGGYAILGAAMSMQVRLRDIIENDE